MNRSYQKFNNELFPNLSLYNRAINYPYFAPDYPFSFYKGKFVKSICFNLENRIPILSVGSNRSPYQLKRKFSLNQDICVTPAKLYDSDIVYAASISSYGSIPATQWPSEGSIVDLNVLWLKKDQLNTMHLTEAVGIAYNFVKMKPGSVKIKDFEYEDDIYGYVSVPGVFSFNEQNPKRLSAINCLNTNLSNVNELGALSLMMKILENKNQKLSNWIEVVTNDKAYRLKLLKKLKSIAIKVKHPNWEVVKIKKSGDLVI